MKGGKIKKIIAVLVVLAAIFSFAAEATAAEGDPTVLAPLPGVANRAGDTTTFNQYVPAIFNLAIGLSAVFAVFMIVVGGFQYISTDAIQKKSDGKERIKNSVYGLIMVICAYLVLYTINPNLLKLDLNIETIKVSPTVSKVALGGESSAGTGKTLAGYTLTESEVKINNAMRQDLDKNYGVKTNAGPCVNGEISGCTNLVGMTGAAFNGVVDLKKACNTKGGCNVTISGGTEGGHSSHGPNLNPIDLRFDSVMDKYILDHQVAPIQTTKSGYYIYTSKVGGRNATFMKESDHWHVVFE